MQRFLIARHTLAHRTQHAAAAGASSAAAAAAAASSIAAAAVAVPRVSRSTGLRGWSFTPRAMTTATGTAPRRFLHCAPARRLSAAGSSGDDAANSSPAAAAAVAPAAALSSPAASASAAATTTTPKQAAAEAKSKTNALSGVAALKAEIAHIQALLAPLQAADESGDAAAADDGHTHADDVDPLREQMTRFARHIAARPQEWIEEVLHDPRLTEEQRAVVVAAQEALLPLQSEAQRVQSQRAQVALTVAEVWRSLNKEAPIVVDESHDADAPVYVGRGGAHGRNFIDVATAEAAIQAELNAAIETITAEEDGLEHEHDEDDLVDEDDVIDEEDGEDIDSLLEAEFEEDDVVAEVVHNQEEAVRENAEAAVPPREQEALTADEIESRQSAAAAAAAQSSKKKPTTTTPALVLSADQQALKEVLTKELSRLQALLASQEDGDDGAGGLPADAGQGGAAAAGGDGADSGSVPPASSGSDGNNSNNGKADSNAAAVSLSEDTEDNDWGVSEFKPQLFNTHNVPAAFASRTSSSSQSVPRVRDVVFLGLSSRFSQLPGQPFSVALPQPLMHTLNMQKMANALALKSPTGRAKRIFLGLFFKDTRREAAAAVAAAKGGAAGTTVIAATDATSAVKEGEVSTIPEAAAKLTQLQRALLVKKEAEATATEKEAKDASAKAANSDAAAGADPAPVADGDETTKPSSSSAPDDSLTHNGETADSDPPSSSSSSSSTASSKSSRSRLSLPPMPRGALAVSSNGSSSSSAASAGSGEAQLLGFESTGVLAEVVDFLDDNYVLVLCHRRITLVRGASGSPVISAVQPHLRVQVAHHDDLSWQQLQPASLRYNPTLIQTKNDCLRLLRALRDLEGEKRFQQRLKPYFAFSPNTPGSIIDFWSTLCTSGQQQSAATVTSPTEQRMMALSRAILGCLDLLPRLQAVHALLQYELQLAQAQKRIETQTHRLLSDSHTAMLSEQRREIEQSLARVTAEAAQAKNQTLGPPTATPAAKKKDNSSADTKSDADASKDETGTKEAEEEAEEEKPSEPDTRTEKEKLLSKFSTRISELQGVPPEAVQALEDEMDKLRGMDSESSFEYSSTRNYLEWLTSLPWGKTTPELFHIRHAEEVLNREHYGMDEVKALTLEFVAIGKMLGRVPQGKILCLVGPPGVGKTSIGKSIASALQRQFYRFSVGGLEDVSEIKGHRRTYVGALPGKLVQALKRVQAANPVILIDEIDKLGRGHRGDPAAALLEVLDPEQNNAFTDHYLDVPVDLSKVLFICTANDRSTIPGPLADRMDFIELSGYLASEKVEIARQYLEPQIRTRTGVTEAQLRIEHEALFHLIRWYCREAGVRSLQKYLEKIYRKVALIMARRKRPTAQPTAAVATSSEAASPVTGDSNAAASAAPAASSAEPASSAAAEEQLVITSSNLKEFAGPPNYLTDKLYEVNPVGVATGLAYSSHGGAVLFIESAIADATPRSLIPQGHTLEAEEEENDDPTRRYDEDQDEEEEEDDDDSLPHTRHNPVRSHAPSRGDLFCTGQMGSVMKESSAIAYTVAKRVLHQRTLPTSPRRAFFEQHRIHLHLPHGATPKDGPSAGIAMVTSLLSLALGVAPRRAHAMTGELSLTGKVHPIGGVKEKLMSAKHAGIELVVLPRQNQRDVDELKPYVIEGLDIRYADSYDEVFELIFPEWKERATSAAAATLPASLAASLPAAANSSSLPADL